MNNTLNDKLNELTQATAQLKAMIVQLKKNIEKQKDSELLLAEKEYFHKLDKLNNNYKKNYDDYLDSINIYKLNRGNSLNKFEEYDFNNLKISENMPEVISFGDVSRIMDGKNVRIQFLMSTKDIKNFVVEIEDEDDKIIQNAMEVYNSFLFKFISSIPVEYYDLIRIDKTEAGKDRTDIFTHSLFKQVFSRTSDQEVALKDLSEKIDLLKEKYTILGARDFEEYKEKCISEDVKITILSVSTTELSDKAKQYLNEILENGVRYGIFVFLLDCSKNNNERNKITVNYSHHFIKFNVNSNGSVTVNYNDMEYDYLVDYLEDHSLAREYFDNIVKYKKELANKIFMYKEIAIAQDKYWSKKSTTEIKAIMGTAGKRTVELEFSDDRTHGLLVGMTGAGKTNLLHVIISSLITSYSPQEVQLYLIDLKGNEMSVYGKGLLPHAKVVAGSASIIFTWNIISDLIEEIEKRKQIFNNCNCSDIKEYKRNGGIMPRILLIIDEYQELFRDSDLSRDNRGLLDKLFRLGRAFGIHILMSSQNVISAPGISEIYSQMSNRIALRIQDVSTAKTVIQDSVDMVINAEKKKEAIYNYQGGRNESIKMNVPLIEFVDRQMYLKNIAKEAKKLNINDTPLMIDFYNKSKLLERKDHPLYNVIYLKETGKEDCLYIGEPLSLAKPVSVQFDMVKRSNLLVLGKKIDDVIGMIQSSLLSLYLNNKYSGNNLKSKFYIVDSIGASGLVTETIQDFMDSDSIEVTHGDNCREVINDILKSDEINNNNIKTYVILLGIHRMSEANADIDLLLKQTAMKNIHTIAYSDDDNLGDRRVPILDEFNYIIAKKGVKCENYRSILKVLPEIDDKEAVLLDITEDLIVFRDYDVVDSDILEEVLEVQE